MSTNKHLNHIAAILMLIVFVFVSVLYFKPDIFGDSTSSKTIGYEKYFDEASVMTAMPLLVAFRPVRKQDLVGEHNAVVWNCV